MKLSKKKMREVRAAVSEAGHEVQELHFPLTTERPPEEWSQEDKDGVDLIADVERKVTEKLERIFKDA